MKKNKILFGILCIFLLMLTACRPIANERKNGEITEGNSSASGTQKSDDSVIVSESGQQIKIPVQSEKGIAKNLMLIEEDAADDIYRYEDEDGNEYVYGKNGVLKTYRPQGYKERRAHNQTATITDEQVNKLANQCASAFCGNEFADFVYEKTEFFPNRSEFEVLYRRWINNVISVEKITITLSYDGQINAISRPAKDQLEGFDETVLKAYTKEKIASYVDEQYENNSVESYEIEDVALQKDESGFYIGVCVKVARRSGNDQSVYYSGDEHKIRI